jgi:hypothetical protein
MGRRDRFAGVSARSRSRRSAAARARSSTRRDASFCASTSTSRWRTCENFPAWREYLYLNVLGFPPEPVYIENRPAEIPQPKAG